MTLPPNIKEEIEKEAEKLSGDMFHHLYSTKQAITYAATKFYLKGVGDREAIAKAAFEAGREGAELKGYDYKDEECDVFTGRMMTAKVVFDYPNYVDYLASDEYKKLVGEI